MNRNNNRQGARGNRVARSNYGIGLGGDGLLGEGPPGGGAGPMMGANPLAIRDTQLALAQSLLQQQQQLMNVGFGGAAGADFSPLGGFGGSMPFLPQTQPMRPPMGLGGMSNDRKRSGGQMRRDHDEKRGRRDSWGRGEQNRSHGNHNRNNQDRDRNQSNRYDTGKEKKKHGEDYDPAEPTEDDEEKDKSNLYCHVCSVSVYDEESLKRHLNGMKHKARMDSIANVSTMRSGQMNSRMKAEEHLRNIERKGGRDPDFFCKICNNDLAMPWEKHRYSNIHKQRLLQVRKGCGWCKVHDFVNFTEVLEHRDTEEHKKNAELYGKKDDSKDESSRHRIKDGKEGESSAPAEEEEEEEEDLTIPEYNPEVPVGLDYVIPVTGYFCKLCHKFYNKKSARATHCQSMVHYEKFKEITEAKISEREKKLEEERQRKEMENAEEEKEEEEIKHENGNEEENDEEGAMEEGEEREQEEAVEDNGGMEEEKAGDVTADVTAEDQDSAIGGVGIIDTSSFVYVPGDDQDLKTVTADQEMADAVTAELSAASINPSEEEDDLDLSVSDEAITTSTPVVAATTKKSTRGKGTAKRGRGRGKSKN